MAVVLVESQLEDGSKQVQSPMKFKASVKASEIYKGIWSFIEKTSTDIQCGEEVLVVNWARNHSNPLVYEDDLGRNYQLLLEILIALKESLAAGEGLPTVKDLQASFLLATLRHNWHRSLYTKRGGKRQIKDWASDEATKVRSLLGHLHGLARRADNSRNQKVQVLKTLYLKMTGKEANTMPPDAPIEDCGPQLELAVHVDEEPIWVEDAAGESEVLVIKDEDADEIETCDGHQSGCKAVLVTPQSTESMGAPAVEDGTSVPAGESAAACPPDAGAQKSAADVDTLSLENNYPDSQPRDPEQWAEWGLSPPRNGAALDQTIPWDFQLQDAEMGDKAFDEKPVGDSQHDGSEAPKELPDDEMPDLAEQQAKLRKAKREEEDTKKAEKEAKKKAKKEGGAMRRPAAVPKGSEVPTEPKELKEPKESKKGKEPKEPKNGKEPKEPKKSKEPKEPKKATKVPKEKVNKGTKRKGTASDDAAISQSPRTDDGDQEAKKLSDKEKRRLRSVESWKRLKEAGIKDLEIPSDLKGRISFTVRDPAEVGSSVGVLLASDAFYISKAVPPPKWPTNCNHLKVDNKQGVTLPWGTSPEVAWGHAKTVAGWVTCHGGNAATVRKTRKSREKQ